MGLDKPNSDILPIGDTGFAWQWVYDGVVRKGLGSYPVGLNTVGFRGSTHSMRLLKIGPIKNGATIPAGIIGYIQAGGSFQPLAMRISKEISITPASCQASVAAVQMGNDYQLEEFNKIGATPRVVKFNINLNDCQSGINKVTYALLPTSTSPAIDFQKAQWRCATIRAQRKVSACS